MELSPAGLPLDGLPNDALEELGKEKIEVEDQTFEMLLLTLSEVFVYKVPPMKSASGHRAEEWGLGKPMFTGLSESYN